jgi:hypothetical protein
MRYQSIAVAMIGFTLLAARAEASDGDQVFETFDTDPIGTTDVIAKGLYFSTTISGGMIEAGALTNPAHPRNQVYGGTTITVVTEDEDMFCWPGVGVWVTGSAVVTLQAYRWDSEMAADVALTPVSLLASSTSTYLSFGTFEYPQAISKVVFSSEESFTIDDLTLGIDGLAPGIPEPASWAMMLGGFGLVGGAMRRRRTGGHAVCPQESAYFRI